MTRNHFLALDGLRGVAALAVAWGHGNELAGRQSPGQYFLAVDFFFILSGFVVAHAYGDKLRGRMKPSEFLRIRLVRLYPLMFLGLVLGAAVFVLRGLHFQDIEWWRLAVSSAFALLALPSLWAPMGDGVFPINTPSWSLSFELLINLVYAPLARHLTRGWLIAWALIGAALMLGSAHYYGDLNVGFKEATLPGGLVRVTFGFGCGLALYSFHQTWRLPPVVGLVIALLLTGLLLTMQKLPNPTLLAITLLAFPAAVWLASMVEVRGALARACQLIGALSYPLYILHMPMLRVLDEATRRANIPAAWAPLAVALWVLACLPLCALALAVIDKPVRKWLTRKTRPARPAAAAA